METMSQNSEPDELANLPWGSHFCLFYKSKQDLLEAVIPFFRRGLEDREYCLWVSVKPLEPEEARQAFLHAIPQAERSLEEGQLEIISYTDFYLTNAAFDADHVLHTWIDRLDAALAKGYTGMRALGNTFWMEEQLWKNFAHYETQLEATLSRRRIKLLCTYALDHASAELVLDVIREHQLALILQNGKLERLERAEIQRLHEEIRGLRNELQHHVLHHHAPASIPATGSFAPADLSAREQAVLRRITQGQANKEIAETLSLSVRTVERYRSSLMKKLGVQSSAELIVYAVRSGLLEEEE